MNLKKIFKRVSLLIIAFFLVIAVPNISYPGEVDDETLAEIKAALNITNASDECLRSVLNAEIETGIIFADQIIALLDQIEFGLQLKSGHYFSQYEDYFNAVLDKNLNLVNFYKGLGRDGIISWVTNCFDCISSGISGSLLGKTAGILFTTLRVIEIDGVILALIKQSIDNYLYYYIDARQSGDSDDAA